MNIVSPEYYQHKSAQQRLRFIMADESVAVGVFLEASKNTGLNGLIR
jgi:hypothetical protein